MLDALHPPIQPIQLLPRSLLPKLAIVLQAIESSSDVELLPHVVAHDGVVLLEVVPEDRLQNVKQVSGRRRRRGVEGPRRGCLLRIFDVGLSGRYLALRRGRSAPSALLGDLILSYKFGSSGTCRGRRCLQSSLQCRMCSSGQLAPASSASRKAASSDARTSRKLPQGPQ